ncbi:MAG: hypothetical protein RL434_2898 [Pseudomonadota bacterium]
MTPLYRKTLLLAAGLSLTCGLGHAKQPAPDVEPEASVEANQVTLSLDRGKGVRGTLSAAGCTGCPLYFDLDAAVLLLHAGQPISALEAAALSGNAGTVIFTRDTRKLLRVLW